jgi:hypothetical protein
MRSVHNFTLMTFAVVLLAACGSNESTLRERIAGLKLSIPKQWSVHRLGVYCRGRVGPGLLITNIQGRTVKHDAAPGVCTNAWNVSSLPKDFILIDISRFDARPILNRHPTARSYPIQDSELQQTSFPRLRALSFWNGNRNFTLRVWTGEQASSGDRKKLVALIKSIRADD